MVILKKNRASYYIFKNTPIPCENWKKNATFARYRPYSSLIRDYPYKRLTLFWVHQNTGSRFALSYIKPLLLCRALVANILFWDKICPVCLLKTAKSTTDNHLTCNALNTYKRKLPFKNSSFYPKLLSKNSSFATTVWRPNKVITFLELCFFVIFAANIASKCIKAGSIN